MCVMRLNIELQSMCPGDAVWTVAPSPISSGAQTAAAGEWKVLHGV